MSVNIEEVVDCGMTFEKPLGLFDRFEPPHTTFPHSRWLMRKFGSVIGILLSIVPDIWGYRTMRYSIAAQFVCNNLPGHTAGPKKTSKETFGGLSIPSFLQININNLAILINCTPKVVLLAVDLHENLV
jgi:hypothetical protein